MIRGLAVATAAMAAISVAWGQESSSAPKPVPVVTTSPATDPVPDVAKGPVDPYDPAAEKMKFFEAAGADNELDNKEFLADQQKETGFVRTFDRWEAMLAFDKNANKTIDWFEADEYRRDLRKRVLAAYDAGKDGRLTGAERDAANRALLAGKMTAPPPASAPAGGASWAQNMQQFDKDGDGQLNDQERAAMREAFRQRMLERYDTDGDGQLSPQERAAMMAARPQGQMGPMGGANPMAGVLREMQLRGFDQDGDGELDEQELAAFDAFRQRADEMGRMWRTRLMDADGDGQVTDDEQQAFRMGMLANAPRMMQRFQKAIDADGDGQVSAAERADFAARTQENVRNWMTGVMSKYDADGDGRLSDKERDNLLEGLNADFQARAARVAEQAGKLGPQEAAQIFEDFAVEMGVLPPQ